VCARAVGGDTTVCYACEAPFHRDCWEYNGGCAVYGCRAAPAVAPVSLKHAPPPRWRMLGLVAGVWLCALVVHGLRSEPPRAPEAVVGRVRMSSAAAPKSPGSFTIRVGAAAKPDANAREVFVEMRVEVRDATGHARVVAQPRLAAIEDRDTYVRLGHGMMFSGKLPEKADPGALAVDFRPQKVRDDGLELALDTVGLHGVVATTYERPVEALRVKRASGGAAAFFERWKLDDKLADEAVVTLIVHRS
jgi:hypothetical protein